MTDPVAVLAEAYQRLHTTGPEFGGFLSNHGPMVAEVMTRHGQVDGVGRWLDSYVRRLEEFPRGLGPVGADWREALGDVRRVADWTEYFLIQMRERPWREVLADWWPRLLPGLIGGATHGVIRVGHVVRALLADGDGEVRRAELAHGLAYWAARWREIPGAGALVGARGAVSHAGGAEPDLAGLRRAAGAALASVPRLAQQSGGVSDRLPRLAALAGWPATLVSFGADGPPARARAELTALADVATVRYLGYGHGEPVLMVHSATAPTAVLRSLPALPPELWAPSARAAWAAAGALTAMFAPADPAPPEPASGTTGPADGAAAEAGIAAAVRHGDEHVIKFADTAADVLARTGDQGALAAARRAAVLIPALT